MLAASISNKKVHIVSSDDNIICFSRDWYPHNPYKPQIKQHYSNLLSLFKYLYRISKERNSDGRLPFYFQQIPVKTSQHATFI